VRVRPIPWFTVPLCMVAVSHDMSGSTAIDKVNGRVCNKDLARLRDLFAPVGSALP